MSSIPHHTKNQIPMILIPSNILTPVFLPDLLRRIPPLLRTDPFQCIEIGEYSWSVDDVVVLTVVDEGANVEIEEFLELSFVA